MYTSCSVETDVELELYEEIVGNLNYTTPVTERSSRPISYSEDITTATTFKGPIIINTSESTVTSASAAIVDSVTWPDLISPCSLAGKNQVVRPLTQRSDGIFTTVAQPIRCRLRAFLLLMSQNSFRPSAAQAAVALDNCRLESMKI